MPNWRELHPAAQSVPDFSTSISNSGSNPSWRVPIESLFRSHKIPSPHEAVMGATDLTLWP